jgi:hypothetical protein
MKKQLINDKKAYVLDTGISEATSFKFSEDRGRILENTVFLELKRKGKEVYYSKGKYECDFVLRKGYKIYEAIQVCKNIEDEQTEVREIRGLIEAMETYKLTEGLLLTENTEGEKIVENKKILIKPIWKWLLE